MRANWFQIAIGVLEIGATSVAVRQGNLKLAGIFASCVISSFLLAVL